MNKDYMQDQKKRLREMQMQNKKLLKAQQTETKTKQNEIATAIQEEKNKMRQEMQLKVQKIQKAEDAKMEKMKKDSTKLVSSVQKNMKQTSQHNVMKKMVPDHTGSEMQALTRGEALQLSGSYTFQGSYAEGTGISNPVDHSTAHTVEEFEDLEVVAWIQDSASWEVYQSAWTLTD